MNQTIAEYEKEQHAKTVRFFRYCATGAAVVAILILFGILHPFSIVGTGYRGVKTVFSEVDMKTGSMPEGLYWFNPFSTSIHQLDTRLQRKEGKANTYTKDIQQADITYVVNYGLTPDTTHIIFKEVGSNWDAILVPQAVEGVLKQIVGMYDAVDLIANRGKATAQAQAAINDSLKSRHVMIERFEMVNIQYLKEYEKSVEAKVIATQKAAEAVNTTKRIQEEARQQVITAQASAEAMRIKANALIANPKLVQYEAVQKWDGHLPQYILGNGVTPFVNLGDLK